MKRGEEDPLLGDYLRNAREAQGKTQRNMCGYGLAPGYVGQVEQGKISDVSVAKFLLLCKSYGVSPIAALQDVYGYAPEPDVHDSTAQQIGEKVLGLPENARSDMLGWIDFQAEKARNQS